MQNDHHLKERQLLVPTIATSSILPIPTVVIATTIFAVDAIAPAQIAVSALYIPVVLLATRFCHTNANTCLHWLEDRTIDLDKARMVASRIVRDGERAGEIIRRVRA